jgi:uncharacterized protein YbjT (DUF2867 family)
LLGRHFLESIVEGTYQSVTAITRRPIPSLKNRSFIVQHNHDFGELEDLRPVLQTDVLVCALGTTIKTAGSQEAFMRIDHDLPLRIAEIAKEEGCRTLVLISSIGADSRSSIFYSRVKGLLENAWVALEFDQLHILRPSMLLGIREESRPAEFIGKMLMKPLSIIIPWKYKPIHASQIARVIHHAITGKGDRTKVWEGKSLFRL